MTFSMPMWCRYYRAISEIGKAEKSLKTEADIDKLRKKTGDLSRKAAQYMDLHGLVLPPAKWLYIHNDSKTHASSPDFAYEHLLSFNYNRGI